MISKEWNCCELQYRDNMFVGGQRSFFLFLNIRMRFVSKLWSKTNINFKASCDWSSPFNSDAIMVGCASFVRKTLWSPTSWVEHEVRWHSHRFDFVRLNVTCVLRVIMTRLYGVVQMNCTCTHPWVSHSIICNTYFIVSPVSRHLQMLLDYGALGMRS